MLRRRWFQFSLRGFLIVVAIGCVLLVWQVEPALRQREAVQAIRAKGGQFVYIVDKADATYTYEEQWISFDYEIKEPKWPPIGLKLNRMVSSDDLRMIARLDSLQMIDMSDATFSGDDLSELRHLSNLRDLVLPIGRFSEECIAELKSRLPHCEVSE